MRSIGIDVGSRYVKAVALGANGEMGFGSVPIRGDMQSSVNSAVKAAVAKVPGSAMRTRTPSNGMPTLRASK